MAFRFPKKKICSYTTYENYLDSHITEKDLYYLGGDLGSNFSIDDIDLARMVVENGFNKKDILSRKEFEEIKKKEKRKHEEYSYKGKKRKQKICGMGKDLANYPLLYEIAKKEKLIVDGRLSIIIFVRDFDNNGHEISGYIDIADRFSSEDFEKYFTRKAKLLPRQNDLSYYNWDTKLLTHKDSNTFSVKADERGLLFKHKRDRKTIDVDPKSSVCGVNSTRKIIKDPNYTQVVVYSHFNRL